MIWPRLALCGLIFAAAGARAQTTATATASVGNTSPAASASTQSLLPDMLDGMGIYQQFVDGLAEPACQANTNTQLQQQFKHAPARLTDRNDNILPLFGYVVAAVRDAGLPTEFALIPFVESGYHPDASSGSGPLGLWQLVSLTARNHGIRVRGGYDGRLSPVDSTRAAVRYLKTLQGMFGGNWQLAVMAYNAGENRVLQAVHSSGTSFESARPPQLPGLSRTTYTYVQKLHALACNLEQAGLRNDWRARLDRPVPRLQPLKLPSDFGSLASWAEREGHNPDQLAGLNPALSDLRKTPDHEPLWVLAPALSDTSKPGSAPNSDPKPQSVLGNDNAFPMGASRSEQAKKENASSYTVARGDSASAIAHRHGLRTQQLLQMNGLKPHTVLKPGMVLILGETAQ